MYLAQLLIVPETLHGYTWPDGFPGRGGTVDLYAQDSQLRMMYRAVLDTVCRTAPPAPERYATELETVGPHPSNGRPALSRNLRRGAPNIHRRA